MGPLMMMLLLNPITVGAGTLFLIGQISRWFQLVEAYPEKTEFKGVWQSFQSIAVNGINFNRCIDIGEDEDYLYLHPRMLMDTVCKPIQIPWEAIQSVRPEKRFLREMLRVQLTRPDVVLHLPAGLLNMRNPYLAYDAGSDG